MSFLLGTAPQANFSTQPTVLPQQQNLLNVLQNLLTPGNASAQGTYQLGGSSLAALEQQAINVPTAATPQQTGATNTAFNTLDKALNFNAPQFNAPQIDSTQAFTQGVVQPLTDDFLQRTLPSIAGKYGAAAGGATSSGSMEARQQAATDLERTLAQTGSTFAYNAAAANQGAQLSTNQLNLSSILGGNQTNLQALGLTPSTLTTPTAPLANDVALAQQTYQPYQQLLADLIAGGTGSTQQTSAVGTGGQSGLLSGLFGNGLGTALGNWIFSDERVKTDMEQVGEVGGFPLYRFKYDGDNVVRIGFKAQDVEKRLPRAVAKTADGTKLVNYGAVVAHLLEVA